MRRPLRAALPAALLLLLAACGGSGTAEPTRLLPDAAAVRTDLGGEFLLGRSVPRLLRRVPASAWEDLGAWGDVVEPGRGISLLVRRARLSDRTLTHVRYSTAVNRESGTWRDVDLGLLVEDRANGSVVAHVYEDPWLRYGPVDHLAGTATYGGFALGLYERGGVAGQFQAPLALTADFDAGTARAEIGDYFDHRAELIDPDWRTVLETDDLAATAAAENTRDWLLSFNGTPGLEGDLEPVSVTGEYRDEFESGSVLGVFYGAPVARTRPEGD